MKIASSLIRETIEIQDNHGNVALSVPFVFNIANSFDHVKELQAGMEKYRADKDMEALGRLTHELFITVFGEDATAKLYEYYDGDYMTLTIDVAPIFTEIIAPAMQAYAEKVAKTHFRAKA